MKICVNAASSKTLAREYFDAAYALGYALAKRGHELVYGGGATGLMGAAAQGASDAGGRIIGVAPKFFDEPGILYERCSEMLFTETMGERKKLMEDSSDAFAVLPGGIGTFEEFFETLTLKSLGRHSKPMALLNTLGYYDAMDAMLQKAVDEGFLVAEGKEMYGVFTDPEELLSFLETDKSPMKEIWKDKIL